MKSQSQERLDVHLQGRAGQVQLEAGDDVRVEDSQTPDALPPNKDLCTATREEGGVWREGRGKKVSIPQTTTRGSRNHRLDPQDHLFKAKTSTKEEESRRS